MSAQASAQEAASTCNGLAATQVVTELVDAGAGTTGDDVIIIDLAAVTTPQERDWNNIIFVALEGNDTICVRSALHLTIYAGVGNDTIIIEDQAEDPNREFHYSSHQILGGSGDDTIINQSATVFGEMYADGGLGNDDITGGRWHDYIQGGPGNDVLRGGHSDDYIEGGEGDDMLYGGWGDDVIDGSAGDDSIYGSRGNDELLGNLGADTIYGGPGNDVLASSEPMTNAHGRGSFDTAGARMFGGEGNDTLWGSNRWDRMQGGPGDDMLAGFEGRDYLRGGPGADNLIGGANIDDMNGNTGRDRIFIEGDDNARGGFGADDCGGFVGQRIEIHASCETTFETTMAMVNMNMMNGGND